MNNRPEEDEVNLLDSWGIMWKRWRMIGRLFLAVVLTVGVVTYFFMPKFYESTATILPPVDSKETGGLGSLTAAGALLSAGLSAGFMPSTMVPASNSDIFMAMLKSRSMADDVIKRFDLMTLFQNKLMADSRKILDGMTKITLTKEKVIKVTVEAKDPKLAADVANFYVSNLDRLNRTLNISKASQQRAFIEKRLAETQAALARAETELKDFQTQNKTVHLDAQGRAAIEAASAIQASITATEVQLQVAQDYLSPANQDVVKLKLELEELKRQLYLMESGKGGRGQLPGERLHPAFITVPSLAMELGRRMREVKVQEVVYTMLVSQYEQAKINEARDTPTVQVLDHAIPAERKSKPSTVINMLISGALALFVGIFLAFFLEYLEKKKREVEERTKAENSGHPSSTEIRPIEVEEEAKV